MGSKRQLLKSSDINISMPFVGDKKKYKSQVIRKGTQVHLDVVNTILLHDSDSIFNARGKRIATSCT
jgi:hypothetical protein